MPYKKPTKAQWVALETEMARYNDSVSPRDVCYMGAIKHAFPIYINDFGGCHAGLSYCKQAHGLVSCIQPENSGYKNLTQEMVISYLNYLLNDSPWAECYVEKDAQVVFDSTFVRVDTSKQSPLVIGAMIALRYLTEHYKVAYNHYYLTQAGVNPDLALLIAYSITGTHDKAGSLGYDGSGHSCLYPKNMNINEWRRFITHEEREDQPSFYEKHGTSGSINYWDRKEHGGVSMRTLWGADINAKALEDGAAPKSSNNPFAHEQNKRALMYNSIIKAIASMNNKMLKEIGV